MARRGPITALIAHGGAGARCPAAERGERRDGLVDAVRRGAAMLRDGASALDAVVATVAALEDYPLFNAGRGSLLTNAGTVEMDASVMIASPSGAPMIPAWQLRRDGIRPPAREVLLSAGGVAGVSRVRNPVVLARAVMEKTPHVLMAGAGAERFAKRAGIELCRPAELITSRARERWLARQRGADSAQPDAAAEHGTVGAVAIDSRGALAAATSTGGVPGKIAGRVGDSAIIGAGTFASAPGAASATGHGETIIMAALCREAVMALENGSPQAVARRAIAELVAPAGSQAGIIIVDRRGRFGFAHNAPSMEVAAFDRTSGIRHMWLAPIASAKSR
ncbi:MAG TPA: isoaspartyl peptidase/L-asparaginase [Candidatus Binataceae bacterium]|nr:isoaspartyl peptidase/L-asparaginase [Candidatus Binataceae bacterium]